MEVSLWEQSDDNKVGDTASLNLFYNNYCGPPRISGNQSTGAINRDLINQMKPNKHSLWHCTPAKMATPMYNTDLIYCSTIVKDTSKVVEITPGTRVSSPTYSLFLDRISVESFFWSIFLPLEELKLLFIRLYLHGFDHLFIARGSECFLSNTWRICLF